MFDLRNEKKRELFVKLDRPDGMYHPGAIVNIRVGIQPKNRLELVGVRVKLRGFEGHVFHGADFNSSTYNYTSTPAEGILSNCAEIFAKEETFLEEIIIPGGTLRQYFFQATIPSDASPSFDDKDKVVRWQVIVKLMGRYLEKEWIAEAELKVNDRGGNDGDPSNSS